MGAGRGTGALPRGLATASGAGRASPKTACPEITTPATTFPPAPTTRARGTNGPVVAPFVPASDQARGRVGRSSCLEDWRRYPMSRRQAQMKLRPLSVSDFALYQRVYTDPQMWTEL